MNKTILYIGRNEKWYLNLKYQIKILLDQGDYDIKEFDFNAIETISKLDNIININPYITVVDYSNDETAFSHLFNKYKSMLPAQSKVFIGISSDLSEKNINKMIDHGMNFCYQKTNESEEFKFIARNILNLIDDRMIKKGNFAVAKTEQNSIFNIREKLTNFNFKNFSLETNYRLDETMAVNFDSNLFHKINFQNNYLKPTITTQTSNNNYLYSSEFSNVLLSKEEISKLKELAIKESKIKKTPVKDLLQVKTLDIAKSKKHKYTLWKKSYQNFYVKNELEEILILSKRNTFIKSKDPKISRKYEFINKIQYNREDQIFLNKINPSFVIIDFEATNYNVDSNTNKAKFMDIRFKQNSIKTILDISQLYQNKTNPPEILVFNKTNIPSDLIRKSLKSSYCKIKVLDVEFNESNISYFLREIDEENTRQEKQKRKENQATNRFFNKKDVLIEKKNLEVPLYFSDIEEINELTLKIDGRIELLSEYQMLVSSTHELPCFQPIKVSSPVNFYFTIIPYEELDKVNKASKFKRYKAIINCISQETRDELRGYIINFEKQYKAVV